MIRLSSLLAALTVLCLSQVAHAATTPSLGITFPSQATVGSTVTAQVTLSTDVAVSGATISLTHTSGLTYVSTSFTNSIFPTTVSGATDSNGVTTFTLVRTDTGYTGTGGLVATVTYTVADSGTQTVGVDQSKSQIIAYSDSSNVLASVATASLQASTTGTLTQTGVNALWVIGGAAVLTVGAFLIGKRRR